MESVPAWLRRLVHARANGRCEYCGLSQIGQEATFHIDHIVPRALGGKSKESNLALACVSCSLRKESRQSAIDPKTGIAATLFHPRKDVWDDHFSWNGVCVRGKTLRIRHEENLRGRHPPEVTSE